MKKLKDSKREDHKDIISSFKEEQSALMNELKGIHKQIREEMDKGRQAGALNQAIEKRRPPRRPDQPKGETRRPSDR